MVLLVSIIHQKEVFSRGRAGLREGRPAGPAACGGRSGAACGRPAAPAAPGRPAGRCAGSARGGGRGRRQAGGPVGAAQPPDEVRLPAAKPRGARPQGARCAAPFPPAQSQKWESSSSADFWLVRVYRGMRMRQAGSRVSRQGLPSTPRDAAKPSCSKSCWLWRLYEPKG